MKHSVELFFWKLQNTSMSKIIKAQVINGRYAGGLVRITNISVDDSGRKNAACFLDNGNRANILVSDLKIIEEASQEAPLIPKAKTVSMPFISGSSSSRTLTHTKNMNRTRIENKTSRPVSSKVQMRNCESCGVEYNSEERRGLPGKVTHCESCATETQNKMEGKMIFSHKTGATIEITKDGELKHEAETFDPKGKS